MNCSLFESFVMFFGIINSPTIFQTMINNIFWNLITESIMIVYLDNILIFTQTLEEHYKAVCRVLEVLAEYKLFLCLEKYEFDRFYTEYLDLVISEMVNILYDIIIPESFILSLILYVTLCYNPNTKFQIGK